VSVPEEPGDAMAMLSHLREPVMGMVSMSRICAHWLKRDDPDLVEVRRLVGLLEACSEKLLGMIQPPPR